MSKQPGSTIVTTINGSRSCYIITNRFAFLSVETRLGRSIHISNNFLNWFWSLFKNVNSLTKRQEKGVYLFFKRNIAHLGHRSTLQTLIIASAKRFKSLFVQAKFTQTLCIWTIHVPNENNSTIVIRTISATHHNCSEKCYTCKQQKSILVEMFDFAVTQVDNFCKKELITVMFKLFDGKDTKLVLFKPKRYSNLSVQMLSYVLVAMTEQFVFCFGKSNLKFGFG